MSFRNGSCTKLKVIEQPIRRRGQTYVIMYVIREICVKVTE